MISIHYQPAGTSQMYEVLKEMHYWMFAIFMNQVALTAPITLAALHSPCCPNEQRGWRMSNNQPGETKEKPGTASLSLNQPTGTCHVAASIQLPCKPQCEWITATAEQIDKSPEEVINIFR